MKDVIAADNMTPCDDNAIRFIVQSPLKLGPIGKKFLKSTIAINNVHAQSHRGFHHKVVERPNGMKLAI